MTAHPDQIVRLERAAGMLLAAVEVALVGRGEHNCAQLCPACREALGALAAQARAEIRGGR